MPPWALYFYCEVVRWDIGHLVEKYEIGGTYIIEVIENWPCGG